MNLQRSASAQDVSMSGADCEETSDKMGYECDYEEKGTGPVATFTATDPEGDPVLWDIVSTTDDPDSVDTGDFRISKDGVLTFGKSPNYEVPADDGGDNTYVVIVRATDDAYDITPADPANLPSKAITKTVTVMVTNVEEPGKVTLYVNDATGQPVLQPQMGVVLTATLSDGDGVTADTIKWQWYRGSTKIIGATDAAYTPVQADIGGKLTAKATYRDGKNSDENDMAEATTIMAVRVAPEDNTGPEFPDQDPSTEDSDKAQERKVAENTPAGRNIGDPVTANDEGDVLAYSVSGTLFSIDIATGQLKTKGKLNREVADGDEHEVTVTAVDPFGETDTATVTIEIENEDESPTITERTAKTMLRYAEPLPGEDGTTPDPVLLWTYAATDHEDDAGTPAVALSWKLEGADRSKLEIGNTTGTDLGQLKFLKNPNFEKPVDANENNVYEVTVVVTDSGRLTDRLVVRVEVTNAKEAGEVTFTAATPRVGVPVTAMLEDPDGDETGHEWQWRVTPTGGTATAIDGATSATFTPRSSDLTKTLSVKVKYTDGKGNDEVTQELTTAVDEPAAPLFYKTAEDNADVVTKFELKLDENMGTFDPSNDKKSGDIYVGHWQDNPNTILRYAVGGADGESFKIVTDENEPDLRSMVMLQAQVALDKEEKASYAVEVTARDSDGSSTTLAVTVKVNNVDEIPDVSMSGADCEETSDKMGYECDYEEKGTGPVATFTATDPEGDPVLWDIVSTTDDPDSVDTGDFRISKDGVLTFGKSPNYEVPADDGGDNTYVVIVRATDDAYDITPADPANLPSKAITKTVTVMVTNVEEPGKVTLYVNDATGQPVLQPQMNVELTAVLTDGDGVTADTIKWQWYRGSTKIIGATEGAGTAMSVYTPLESDIRSGLTAKATYMDGQDANNQKMAENSRTRAVRDVPQGGNTGPAFPDQDPSTEDIDKAQERKVAENTPAGRNIGAPVRANDQGDVLAYSLSGTDASLFAIDIATGQLKTKGKLNREVEGGAEREVTVTAVDPSGVTDMATVTIEIENEDESPTITERTAKTMLKYAEPLPGEDGTTPDPVLLWTYAATDHEDDAGTSVALSWKLEGADRSKLEIGNTTGTDLGQLKFLKNPNFEKPVDANENNVYEVTVVVTDSGRLTDRLVVRVEVTNAKEAGEVTFTAATPRVGVPVTAMLEDPDGDETGHEWQWRVTPTGGTATAIDGATSATFTPRSSDLTKTLSVKVKYTDGKGNDEVTQELTTAVDEPAAPLFYKTAEDNADVVTKFELKLDENMGTFDPSNDKKSGDIYVGHRNDAPNTILRYAVGGADGESFKIVTDENEPDLRSMVMLQAQVALDKEEKSSYAVEVTARDSRGGSTTLVVTVKVNGLDEAPVVMLGPATGVRVSGDSSQSVAEGTTAVATYTASGPNEASARWTLSGTDAGDFRIGSSSGVLTFAATPDYEAPADGNGDNVYMVTVTATDSEGASDSIDVTVTVTDVTEAVTPPQPTTLLERYDADDSGDIDQPEVIEAINDYLFGTGTDAITKDQAIEVINLYLFG